MFSDFELGKVRAKMHELRNAAALKGREPMAAEYLDVLGDLTGADLGKLIELADAHNEELKKRAEELKKRARPRLHRGRQDR